MNIVLLFSECHWRICEMGRHKLRVKKVLEKVGGDVRFLVGFLSDCRTAFVVFVVFVGYLSGFCRFYFVNLLQL